MAAVLLMVAAAITAAPSALDISGSAVCPTPATVAARALPLLPPGRPLPPGLAVRVDDVAEAGAGRVDLELRLERAGDPTPLASRRVRRSGSCEDLADLAAVIVASWAGRYETTPPAALTLVDRPAPRPAARAAPSADDGSPTAASVRRAAGPAGTNSPPPLAWSAGAATWLAAGADGGPTPYVAVELTAGADRGQGWFGRLLVAGTGERELPVAGGTAAWRRLLVMPAAGWSTGWASVGGRRMSIEIAAGPIVGPVFVAGRGFAEVADDVGLDVGIAPTLRLGLPLWAGSRMSVWLGGGAVAWLRPHRLSVDGFGGRPVLPWLDGMAGGGVSYRLN